MNTNLIVKKLKSNNQDFEWYPTTDDMIKIIKDDILLEKSEYCSILDIGSGDGRVLESLTLGDKYAIEKSRIFHSLLDKDIIISGTDFHEAEILGIKVDFVFCNPPYSEYSEWMSRIIKESFCDAMYFIVPRRWKDCKEINRSLSLRGCKYEILGEKDFLDADRKARAKVNIVKVYGQKYGNTSDPFSLIFNEAFSFDDEIDNFTDVFSANPKINEMVCGANLIEYLVEIYNDERSTFIETYKVISNFETKIFKELGIGLNSIRGRFKSRIDNLKQGYWNELFNNYSPITNRLTYKSRMAIMEKIAAQTGVSFTCDNAYAITIRVIKNANSFYDQQIIETFELMVDECNIKKYKSNQRVIKDDNWKYINPKKYGAVSLLDYRVIVGIGGISVSDFSYIRDRFNGLDESAFRFINDLIVIGKNLGWSFDDQNTAGAFNWTSGKMISFNGVLNGNNVVFMTVRAYKNGNLHLKFNSCFILRLNVQMGKIKGWIKRKEDILDEMNYGNKELKGISVDSDDLAGELWSYKPFSANMSSVNLIEHQ